MGTTLQRGEFQRTLKMRIQKFQKIKENNRSLVVSTKYQQAKSVPMRPRAAQKHVIQIQDTADTEELNERNSLSDKHLSVQACHTVIK